MVKYRVYLDNGAVKTFHAAKVIQKESGLIDLIFLDSKDDVIAEFNSEHIAGYSIVEEEKKV